MALTITRNLDVSPGAVPACVHIKQYASDFVLKFVLFSSDGTLLVENGTTAFIRGTKIDGKGFQLGATRSGNTITFPTASATHEQIQQMTAIPGDNLYEVVLKKEGKELPCGSFILRTQAAAMDESTITDPSNLAEIESRAIETVEFVYGGINIRIEDDTIIVE